MKFYKLIYLIIIISLLSCQKVKNDQVDATIYVKQYKTATPISNAMVLITRGIPPSGFGTTILDTLFTDASGKVIYKKVVDPEYMYYAEAYKEHYDRYDFQVLVTPGKKDFTNRIYLYANSYVKLHVKNINPYNQFDYIRISTFCLNFSLQGMDIDTTFFFCDYGYDFWGDFPNYGYGFNVTKNNIDTSLIYYFVPPPHDTITLNVFY